MLSRPTRLLASVWLLSQVAVVSAPYLSVSIFFHFLFAHCFCSLHSTQYKNPMCLASGYREFSEVNQRQATDIPWKNSIMKPHDLHSAHTWALVYVGCSCMESTKHMFKERFSENCMFLLGMYRLFFLSLLPGQCSIVPKYW